MKRSQIIRVVLACAAFVALACVPQAAFAQRGGGHGGGGGGGFHDGGGGGFHAGGGAGFSGGAHAGYGGGHYGYSGAHGSGGYRGGGYGAGGYHGGGYYGHGGYGWYGGRGYYGWGGRYWGYPGYGWGWGIGFGWPYWGWGYPYGYYGYGAVYAPGYTYTYPPSSDGPPQQNQEQGIDPNAYPFTCPPGYTCIQDGTGDPAPPQKAPANAAPRPSSGANPQPWRAPVGNGSANVGVSTESYYVPRGRVMSEDHIVATQANYRTAVPAKTVYGPMSPELKRAMQMLHEMPPFAREREIATGRYSHFTAQEKQLLRSVN